MTFIFERNSAHSTLDKPPLKCGKGQAWDEIAIFNSLVEECFFKVTPRSVPDWYSLLAKKYKSKWGAEDKASGIAPNRIEIDEALHDLIERFDEADTAR